MSRAIAYRMAFAEDDDFINLRQRMQTITLGSEILNHRITVLTLSLGLCFCFGRAPYVYSEDDSPGVHIPNTAAVSQLPELPNGCEAAAAAMLLNWAGIAVTKEEVADALPKGDMPAENEDGAMIGANPGQVFVGDPYDAGFGIFHEPVASVLDSFLPGKILDISGSSFDVLLDTIKSGRPAVVWATEDMQTPYLSEEWQDGDGRLIDWYEPEHALLMTGWDDDNAYMNDPMTGKEETYDLWQFKSVWEAMGSQAITVIDRYSPPSDN